MNHLKTPRALWASVAAVALTLTACGSSDPEPAGSPTPAPDDFSITQENHWGTTVIEGRPERVATASGGDTHIAYALGIAPVIQPVYPGAFIAPYEVEPAKALGLADPPSWDNTDSTDFIAIKKADPDVILAMNSYTIEEDYAQLAAIAPVVTYAEPSNVNDLTWQDRTRRAAEALGMKAEGDEVIAAAEQTATDAAAAHPEFAGKTYTYVVVHPQQLTYASYSDQDPGVMEALGFVKAPKSAEFSSDNDAVSLENVVDFDADVVLIAYPFGDEGVISRADLEANKLWQSIPAVKEGRWAVVDAESGLAADMAYPSVLSFPWVVEQMTPLLADAVNGRGSSTG